MTKVTIEPGVCGFTARVTADSEDGQTVRLTISSGCGAVAGLTAALGDTFDAFELCLCKPGQGPLYAYAGQHFPGHGACPVLAGITKCVEKECGPALPKDASITFGQE